MKKLFTFASALLFAVSAMAQTTVFEWEGNATSTQPDPTVGTLTKYNIDGYASIKVNTNSTTVYGLKCGSSAINSGSVTKFYCIKTDGGFLAGDTLIYAHAYNNSGEKTTTIAVFDVTSATPLYTGKQTVNARNAEGYTLDTCVLANDIDSLALGRVGSTSTFIMSMKVIRPAGSVVATKYTVSYYDGETLLGTEKVVDGETPTKANLYEAKAHHTFDGWFNDAAFTSAADFTATITADKAFYGKWTEEAFVASTSVNIEQYVLDNGKNNAGIKAALDAAHITYANINDLDSLNDEKTGRNEPFLGLKIKAAGGYVEAGLQAGDVLRVKFGNVAADVKLTIAGVESTLAKADATTYEYTATANCYVRVATTTSGTVVLKQIMINQPIASVTLPDTPTDIEEIEVNEAQKVMIDGQIYIIKNGVRYNMLGAVVE